MQVRDIFIEALQKSDQAERTAFLAASCGPDAALRKQVEELLAVHFRQESFLLDAPPEGLAAEPTAALPAKQSLGSQIGPYKLLQQIGEGGMGIVYMAEQREPVERKVALKIIKPGMDSRQVIARFEAERQALALMDHPNIARVLDAGTTQSGQPFFVMELVKGVPITKYCDEKHLSLKDRLELMIPVCQAIQHAHQKGIIHRDIKPTNILIAQYDGRPVPKVIDFGVAKATAQKLTERTMFTELGQIVGTIEYMSPEQAELNQLDIDTRSDIYSLGVLLYELLTGSTPFDKQQLRTAAFHEMLRIIREDEPPKPSTNLSTSGTLPSIAANRQTEPARLSNAVRGELDWIVMKALEKDRNRRYETANGFAADIQRYLNDEQVQACPPSATYRFRKFARRNKVTLTTAAVVAAALITGTLLSMWQAIEANRARGIADQRLISEQQARHEAEEARKDAEDQRQRAQSASQRAEEQRDHAEASFRKSIDAVDRMLNRVANVTLRNVPQAAEARKTIMLDTVELLESLLQERPEDFEVRYRAASAYSHMYGSFVALGMAPEANRTADRAQELLLRLHEEQPGHLGVQYRLAGNYAQRSQRTDNPEKSLRHAIALLARVANDESVDSDTRATFRFDQAKYLRSLAQHLTSLYDLKEAEQALRDSINLLQNQAEPALHVPKPLIDGPIKKHLKIDELLSQGYLDLGRLLNRTGRIAESTQALEHAWEWGKKALEADPTDPFTRQTYASQCYALGDIRLRNGRPEDARSLFRMAFPVLSDLLDAPHDGYRRSVETQSKALIRAYQRMGNIDDVREYLAQLKPLNAGDYVLRAGLYETLGDKSAAMADYEKALEMEPGNTAAQQALARIKPMSP